MAKGVFVSYRRDDAAHITGRIHDALVARLGQARVFMDVDSVAPGEDFVRKIRDTIAASDVFLVIIGPGWLEARTAAGQRRIDLPGDFVRIEVAAALAQGLKIIPVLVDGANMPRAEDLPEDVAQLTRHNAVFLSHATFKRDMDALAGGIARPGALQWLASPQGLALLAGGLALAALAMVITRGPGEDAGAPLVAGAVSAVSLAEGSDMSGRTRFVSSNGFRSERGSDGRLVIAADIPYRDRVHEAGEITGLAFMGSPFVAEAAELDVTVTNRGDAALAIREIQFEVVSAEPDLRALPVIREAEIDYRLMRIVNEGWGPMEPVLVRIDQWGLPEKDFGRVMRMWRGTVSVMDPCAEPSRRLPGPGDWLEAVPREAGFPDLEVELGEAVPAAYDSEAFVCASGELQYSSLGEVRKAVFRARVSNELPRSIVASPGMLMHDLYLDPEREGYVAIVPASFEVPAGETVTVRIVVRTDKSTVFSLVQRLRTADGRIVPGEALGLEFFVPSRGGVISMLNPERMADVPVEFLAGVRGVPDVVSAQYDPQGNNAAIIDLAGEMVRPDCERFARHVSGRLGRVTGRGEAEVFVYGPDDIWMCGWPVQD
ncbi:toll/interleukin-1 receptor domain-containing protein [Hyphomonas sp.]|uniref:toll/interleukin-1 receptor domain-containing protein n=1 Tax=Hyphomonas sp. TaxID=87 RepID=UPI00391C9938